MARLVPRKLTITVHEIAVDGLPSHGDYGDSVNTVAFIVNGYVVSGWPLPDRTANGLHLWRASPVVSDGRAFTGVTHWIEFSESLNVIESTHGDGSDTEYVDPLSNEMTVIQPLAHVALLARVASLAGDTMSDSITRVEPPTTTITPEQLTTVPLTYQTSHQTSTCPSGRGGLYRGGWRSRWLRGLHSRLDALRRRLPVGTEREVNCIITVMLLFTVSCGLVTLFTVLF